MSLRTYPLIDHPAYIQHVANELFGIVKFNEIDALATQREIPRLKNILSIASYLGIPVRIVQSAMLRPAKHYNEYAIPKRSGGTRIICAPRTSLKVIQWWILDTILDLQPVHDVAYGFRRDEVT